MNNFFSVPIRIIETPLTKTALRKMCRSRKQRVIKKWKKNPRNYTTIPDLETIYISPFGYICHPVTAKNIRNQIEKFEIKDKNGMPI